MSIAVALAETLRQRGTPSAAASLAAEAGLAIVKVGFEQWARDTKDRNLAVHLRAARRQLEAVLRGGHSPRRPHRQHPQSTLGSDVSRQRRR